MNTFRNLTAALLATIVVGLVPTGPSSASEAPTQLTLINATEAQAATTAESIAQFEDASLELPPLQIEFFDTDEGCDGNSGMYFEAVAERGESVDRIMICGHQMTVMLHELAHAWSRHQLTDETRAQFTKHWGLERWRDNNDAQLDRGVERAAETIAFTLRSPALAHTAGVLRYLCAYEVLTGTTTAVHSTITC